MLLNKNDNKQFIKLISIDNLQPPPHNTVRCVVLYCAVIAALSDRIGEKKNGMNEIDFISLEYFE